MRGEDRTSAGVDSGEPIWIISHRQVGGDLCRFSPYRGQSDAFFAIVLDNELDPTGYSVCVCYV